MLCCALLFREKRLWVIELLYQQRHSAAIFRQLKIEYSQHTHLRENRDKENLNAKIRGRQATRKKGSDSSFIAILSSKFSIEAHFQPPCLVNYFVFWFTLKNLPPHRRSSFKWTIFQKNASTRACTRLRFSVELKELLSLCGWCIKIHCFEQYNARCLSISLFGSMNERMNKKHCTPSPCSLFLSVFMFALT